MRLFFRSLPTVFTETSKRPHHQSRKHHHTPRQNLKTRFLPYQATPTVHKGSCRPQSRDLRGWRASVGPYRVALGSRLTHPSWRCGSDGCLWEDVPCGGHSGNGRWGGGGVCRQLFCSVSPVVEGSCGRIQRPITADLLRPLCHGWSSLPQGVDADGSRQVRKGPYSGLVY